MPRGLHNWSYNEWRARPDRYDCANSTGKVLPREFFEFLVVTLGGIEPPFTP
jgi:hypothetical protein